VTSASTACFPKPTGSVAIGAITGDGAWVLSAVVTLGCAATVDARGGGAVVVGATVRTTVATERLVATVVGAVVVGAVDEVANVEVVGADVVTVDSARCTGGRADEVEAQPVIRAIANRSVVRLRMSHRG
jgi:hypothetical protein